MSGNPYETGEQKAIPAVLIYARRGGKPEPDELCKIDDEVLMLHRNSPDRPRDFHAGKWNGLGGKCERGESPLDCAVREFREESGMAVSLERFHAQGVVTFPNFKPKKCEDWLVFLFTVDLNGFETPENLPCAEGTLRWIRTSEVMALNLWSGDREFLPKVLAGESVMGTVVYESGEVTRVWMESL